MNTAEFFAHVLPDEGQRVVGVFDPRVADPSKRLRHKFLTSNAHAAAFVATADQAPLQIFHACHGYGASEGGRKGANVVACRSFYLDLDCGEGKPYADKAEAVTALFAFMGEVGLPTPLMVSSGRGVHVYWAMDADVSPTIWRTVAAMLKAACSTQGLRADPARTSDIASILRPVGSTHRKGDPKPVKVIRPAPQTSLAAFRGALEAFVGLPAAPAEDVLGAAPAHLAALGPVSNADLGERGPYPPAYADRIADQCGVMELIRRTRGQVDQPTWYHGLQLLNKCEDGYDASHEWSKGDRRYDPKEVDAVLARTEAFGPTLCSKFMELQPAICGECPHQVSSPIVLGIAPPAPAVIVPAAPVNPFGGTTEVAQPISMPWGYQWRPTAPNSPVKAICRLHPKPDEDGSEVWVPITQALFYPVERLDSMLSGAAVEIEVLQRGGIYRRFMLHSSLIAKGGAELAAELGKHEIMAEPGAREMVAAYLSAWVVQLARNRDAVMARSHFGWHDDSFLIGNTLLSPGGKTHQVVLEGMAADKEGALGTNGSLAEWVRHVDTAYNRPGQEAFQFMLMCGFAAPIFAMFKTMGGLTVHAHSDGSGVGKTTAQRAALSIWGDYQKLQLSDRQATGNAFYGLLGTYANIPVVLDELTNMTNAQASDIVFLVSGGVSKQRMTQTAGLNKNASNWKTLLMTSGNMLLSDKIGQHRGDAEGELMRLFEFSVDSVSHLSPNDAETIFTAMLDNHGHAGLAFMRYVVDNRAKVQATLDATLQWLNTQGGIAQPERFWARLFASILTSLAIAKKLGLVSFRTEELHRWLMRQLRRNRQSREANINDPLMLFGEMLTDLWSGVLITEGEGNLRKGASAPLVGPRPFGQLTGRAVVPHKTEPPLLVLSTPAIKAWCGKRNVSHRAMFDALVARKCALPDTRKYVLGKGTREYGGITSQIPCWVLDPRRLDTGIDAPIGDLFK